MTTIAHYVPAIQAPDQTRLTNTRQLVGEAQRFIAEIWQAHPLLKTLDPSLGGIMRQHLRHCCEQANAYEIGVIGNAALDGELSMLCHLLDQMQQAMDDALRIQFEYADSLTDALTQTKPEFATLMAQRVAQTWDALTAPAQTITRIRGCFTRMEQLIAIAEFVASQEDEHV